MEQHTWWPPDAPSTPSVASDSTSHIDELERRLLEAAHYDQRESAWDVARDAITEARRLQVENEELRKDAQHTALELRRRGLHFCTDWDYLLIGKGEPEMDGCTCGPTRN